MSDNRDTAGARTGALETDYPPLAVFAWATVLGLIAGLVGAFFRRLVSDVGHRRLEHLHALGAHGATALVASMLATAVMLTVALWLVRRFAPEAGGSGVQEIEGALDGMRTLRWRHVLPVKFVSGLLALGGGLVLGREGPTIQLGGNLGAMVGDLLRLPHRIRRTLVAAGAGAGVAAAFNAPLAGVLFVLEELRPQFEYTFTSVQAVVIACAVADIVVRALTGQGEVIAITHFPAPPLESLWLFPIFGAVMGLLGVAFVRALIGSLDLFARWTPAARRAVGPLVGAAIGLVAWLSPDAVGGGDELIQRVLADHRTVAALCALFAMRFATGMVSYGCGAPGGIFAPMLALGTLFGMAYGTLAQGWFPGLLPEAGVFAVAGMGALFTAVVRAPITGVALAIELTANYHQILPLLLTCTAATIVAELLGSEPVYTLLLRRSLGRS